MFAKVAQYEVSETRPARHFCDKGVFFSLLSRNFDDQLSSNVNRFVIMHIDLCWDTPRENTGLWQLPNVSSAFTKYSVLVSWWLFCCVCCICWCRGSVFYGLLLRFLSLPDIGFLSEFGRTWSLWFHGLSVFFFSFMEFSLCIYHTFFILLLGSNGCS